jgi:adenylate kinase family enzyme
VSNIVHLLGPTCAGKSTLINRLLAIAGDIVGAVEVGKMLRAKYLDPKSPHYQPDFFKGQAAPQHTQAEAWQMYQDGVKRLAAEGKKIILVDGQPRDIQQARDIIGLWHAPHRSIYLLVHASEGVRAERAVASRTGDSLELAKARLKNDYENCYNVMVELTKANEVFRVLDSTELGTMDGLAELVLADYGS